MSDLNDVRYEHEQHFSSAPVNNSNNPCMLKYVFSFDSHVCCVFLIFFSAKLSNPTFVCQAILQFYADQIS